MKDIIFLNYKGDIDAIITAEPDRYGNEYQQLAWYIDGFYAGTEGAHDIWLAGAPMGEYRNDAMLLEYAIPESGTTVELSLQAGSDWFDPGQEVTVDWGDGSGLTIVSATSGQSGYIGHEYASEGNYIVKIAGSLKLYGKTALEDVAGQELLTHIRSFGQLGVISFQRAFHGGTGLISVPKHLPSSVTNMSYMFQGCSGASFNPDVSPWDTSNVTDMRSMFNRCSGAAFNPDVSAWDVSKVKNMLNMFRNCSGDAFNPDVSAWDVSSVTNMSYMFNGCSGAAFNPDVSAWDVSSVTNMSYMFNGCSGASFNPDVSPWDTSNVTDMRSMFNRCSGAAFNPDVSAWDVSKVKNMLNMFRNCSGDAFNPDVSAWDVSSVTNMSYMFNGCSGAAFNPDVSAWDVSSVTNMSYMFNGCSGASFNPDVSPWDTSNVTDMRSMFNRCSGAAFRGGRGASGDGLKNWILRSAGVNMSEFMQGAKIQEAAWLDEILIAWAARIGLPVNPLPTNVTIVFPSNQPYRSSISGDALTALEDAGWTISTLVDQDV